KLTQTSGNATLTLNLPANGGPPTPQLSNFAQIQSFDPTADLTATWGAFLEVKENDTISFEMNDEHTHFQAPDPCVPRLLPNTATSILVPKNTFGVGGTMDGSLTFNKFGAFDTNTVPGMVGISGYSKTTSFKPGGGGTTIPDRPT